MSLRNKNYFRKVIVVMYGIVVLVYDILKRNNIETVIVDYNKRVPKDRVADGQFLISISRTLFFCPFLLADTTSFLFPQNKNGTLHVL